MAVPLAPYAMEWLNCVLFARTLHIFHVLYIYQTGAHYMWIFQKNTRIEHVGRLGFLSLHCTILYANNPPSSSVTGSTWSTAPFALSGCGCALCGKRSISLRVQIFQRLMLGRQRNADSQCCSCSEPIVAAANPSRRKTAFGHTRGITIQIYVERYI